MRFRRSVATAALIVVVAAGCGTGSDELDSQLGGGTTRQDASRNSFGLPAPTLTNEERRNFEVGDSFFTSNWVTAPASTESRDGLGPTFNAQACSSCHVLDGRGAPFDDNGDEPRLGLLLRISIPGQDAHGGPLGVPNYGTQLQDRSVNGVTAEGTVGVRYATIDGTFSDGTPYSLRKPTYSVINPNFGPLPDDVMISPRLAPQVIGVGLLETIPEETIRAAADPDDDNGDGISGRANDVWSAQLGQMALGRFGWKANVAAVEDQVAGAFSGDIGISSRLAPEENCPSVQNDCRQAASGGSPELTDSRLASVSFYSRTLSVPALRDPADSQVREGAEHFDKAGCVACHVTTMKTGTSSIAALSGQTIHPYTDLLLHDMGPGLADGRPDFLATAQEWRTPPLWGIGLIDEVNGARFLLHDGRARTLEEAILWHDGEAADSQSKFIDMDQDERAALVRFLESL